MEPVTLDGPPVFTGEWMETTPSRNVDKPPVRLLEIEVRFASPVNRSWLGAFLQQTGLMLSGEHPETPTQSCLLWARTNEIHEIHEMVKSLRGAVAAANRELTVTRQAIDGAEPHLHDVWD